MLQLEIKRIFPKGIVFIGAPCTLFLIYGTVKVRRADLKHYKVAMSVTFSYAQLTSY